MSLVDVAALKHIWRFSRGEFFVSIVALVGVLGSGPVSVLLGAAISIVLLLRQASRPRVVELARVPGTTVFADRSRHPETRVQPGLLIVRCESALLYFNVEFIRERVFEILQARAEPIRFVVFALRTVPKVDLAGAELLADLHRSLRARAVAFCVADSRGEVRGAARNGPDRRGCRDGVAGGRGATPPGYGGISGTPEHRTGLAAGRSPAPVQIRRISPGAPLPVMDQTGSDLAR